MRPALTRRQPESALRELFEWRFLYDPRVLVWLAAALALLATEDACAIALSVEESRGALRITHSLEAFRVPGVFFLAALTGLTLSRGKTSIASGGYVLVALLTVTLSSAVLLHRAMVSIEVDEAQLEVENGLLFWTGGEVDREDLDEVESHCEGGPREDCHFVLTPRDGAEVYLRGPAFGAPIAARFLQERWGLEGLIAHSPPRRCTAPEQRTSQKPSSSPEEHIR